MIVFFFIVGYALIALEQPAKLDKAATALLTGTICWIVLRFSILQMPAFAESAAPEDVGKFLNHALFEHLGEIAGILFFLLGAMTIVELVDAHDGFSIITDRIHTSNRIVLLWVIVWITFFLSAILDNMTTAIIMCALLRRILKVEEEIWMFGGFVVIAANAGGAWSPIGDVTTIMLWIGGQVTTLPIIQSLLLPSIACLLVPLALATFFMRGQVVLRDADIADENQETISTFERNIVFFVGAGGLLFVPVFKQYTHFPPYMGVLFVLGVLWYVTEWLHRTKHEATRHGLSVSTTLQRIDTPSILFFFGILLAVAALDTSGHLNETAALLNRVFSGNIYVIDALIGVLSAIVDNVPLVAAAMGMYDLATFPPDHHFWTLLAYCAGTGGSILIIGSAAGVAAMGILKMNFLWYLRRISWYALIGYASGILVYAILN